MRGWIPMTRTPFAIRHSPFIPSSSAFSPLYRSHSFQSLRYAYHGESVFFVWSLVDCDRIHKEAIRCDNEYDDTALSLDE